MKFSQKFLIVNFIILAMFIVSNIFALKYFSTLYFGDYVVTIKKDSLKSNIDFDIISKLLENQTLDKDIIEEYKKITDDLSSISMSLEDFSNDPKTSNISLIDSLQKIWIPSSSIEKVIWTNALQAFFWNISNFFTIDSDKPEWIFVIKTLKWMALFNLFLIIFISFLVYFWVKYTFMPISHIISNLSNIIYKKQYKNIFYKKKDEFSPLIEAINNLNKSLSLQEKIRSDFLSDLSHEIKTPITAVKCYLEWIEDWVITLDEKSTKLLHDEIDRLIKITNLIMEYEKEESKKLWDIFISKINLIEILEFVSSEYSFDLNKNNQEIIFSKEKSFFILADKDKITQIIHNIFSNFLKYAWQGTKLNINFQNRNKSSIIVFKDNWVWINNDELPFVKEKFYKVEKSRTKWIENWIWIWLSVIEKIVSLHSWTFEIISNNGLELRISLPR